MAEIVADSEGVNRALASLVAWPEIARSPQLANFLTYIVERRLRGDAQSIKAYSIAVDVFGRAPDFDPQADPIVRVQARRLRGLLDQYYRGPGADDPIRILLPIGRYVPEFVAADDVPVAAVAAPPPPGPAKAQPVPSSRGRPRGHVTLSWFVLLVLALGAVAATYSLATWGPRRDQQVAVSGAMQMPRLRIMEFQNLTGDNRLSPSIAALAVELVTDFDPLLIVDVLFGGRGDIDGAARVEDFVLTGIVRRDSAVETGYQFSAILTDAATNSVVWNWASTISAERISEAGGISFVSQELILRLGGPRGPLHVKARELLARTDISGQENFYLCSILFVAYRTLPSPGNAARLDACLRALPESAEMNGNVLAARASLVAEAPLDARWAEEAQRDRYAQADNMLVQALRIAPTSSFVWEQQARLYEAQGEHDKALAAYGTSLQLNSANIDAMAAYARLLSLVGRLDAALPLARRAIDAVPPLEVPDWFECVPALGAWKEQNLQTAARLAQECARVDKELGPIVALLVAHDADDAKVLAESLPRILEQPTFRGYGILRRLRVRMSDEDLIDRIRRALVAAGVPEASIEGAY